MGKCWKQQKNKCKKKLVWFPVKLKCFLHSWWKCSNSLRDCSFFSSDFFALLVLMENLLLKAYYTVKTWDFCVESVWVFRKLFCVNFVSFFVVFWVFLMIFRKLFWWLFEAFSGEFLKAFSMNFCELFS